jgi:hypothetical protein
MMWAHHIIFQQEGMPGWDEPATGKEYQAEDTARRHSQQGLYIHSHAYVYLFSSPWYTFC